MADGTADMEEDSGTHPNAHSETFSVTATNRVGTGNCLGTPQFAHYEQPEGGHL